MSSKETLFLLKMSKNPDTLFEAVMHPAYLTANEEVLGT